MVAVPRPFVQHQHAVCVHIFLPVSMRVRRHMQCCAISPNTKPVDFAFGHGHKQPPRVHEKSHGSCKQQRHTTLSRGLVSVPRPFVQTPKRVVYAQVLPRCMRARHYMRCSAMNPSTEAVNSTLLLTHFWPSDHEKSLGIYKYVLEHAPPKIAGPVS